MYRETGDLGQRGGSPSHLEEARTSCCSPRRDRPGEEQGAKEGGYPWAVIRFDQRRRYMQALDAASFGGDIPPFAKLISEHLSNKLRTAGNGDPKSNVDGLFRV